MLEKIEDARYEKELDAVQEQLANLNTELRKVWKASEGVEDELNSKIDIARTFLHSSLWKANIETRAREETITGIVERMDRPQWRDMSLDEPSKDEEGKVTRQAKIDFGRLKKSRELARGKGEVSYRRKEEIKQAMERTLSYLHRDLLEGPEGVMLKEINWESDVSIRARAHESKNHIVLDRHDEPSIAMHEFGHHLEFRNRRVKSRILDFYNERTEGIEPHKVLSEEGDEWFKEPKEGKKFFVKYASKLYFRNSITMEQADTELLSMGMEALESPYRFRDLVKHDPEHLAIVLATIRGY